MIATRTIPGPWGRPFLIPAEPGISEHSERCCRNVFDGEYEYPRAVPEDVRTLVDVGGNIGAFVRFAQGWWPSLRVFRCYEPNPPAFEILRHNAPLAQIWGCAVTVEPTARLEVDDNWGGAHTYQARSGWPVEVMHPRDLPDCDVLKIDAEGCEPEILENYPHLAACRVVLYEYHTREHRERCAFACQRAGLTLVKDPDAGTSGVAVWVRRG